MLSNTELHYLRDTNGDVLAEYDISGNLLAEYIYANGQRIARVNSSGDVHVYLNDHLGSARAMLGTGWSANYYPYGQIASQSGSSAETRFDFTGQERDQGTGLLYFGARYYHDEFGRFVSVDRFAEKYPSHTPYHYTLNNPVRFIDINGDSTFVTANNDGTYRVTGGNLSGAEDDTGIYARDADGNLVLVGNSITTHSFFDDEGEAVVGAVIDPTSYEGTLFILGEIIGADPSLIGYMRNATGGQKYDFKNRGKDERAEGVSLTKYHYRGSAVPFTGSIPTFGSARDFGNIGAGIIAGRKGLSWETARLGFDALESIQQREIAKEGAPTQKAQRVGYLIGVRLRKVD